MKRIFIVVFALLSTSIARADEGMWLLSLLGKNIDTMQEMGFKLTAEDVYSVNQASLKDAIVGFGNEGRPFRHFCTGEIISSQGLVLTNHHCAFSAIQSHSTVEHDYLSDGFWAYELKQELANPGITASILHRMEDVTERINGALYDGIGEAERSMVIDSISKIIISDAVSGSRYSAQVQNMFEGNQFFLFVYTIYRDVRLVGAPPQSMGKFGGDTDNWTWPRHTDDFALFRIYTDANGQPSPFSPNNVPLKPKHHLPVSAKGIQDGDFAMTMGFPGSTDRFLTSFGLKETIDITNDIRYKVRTEKLRVMRERMDEDPKVRIQYASKYASCANYWKYSFEQNQALEKLNTMARKQQIEREFTSWVNSDAGRRNKYGNALNMIREGYEDVADYAVTTSYLQEALGGPEAHMFAFQASNILEKLCSSEISENEKNQLIETLKMNSQNFFKDFDKEIDKNLFATLFRMYSENVDPEMYPEIIEFINKKYKGNYEKFAQDMADKSIFMNEDLFNEFLQKPDKKKLDNDLAYKAGKSFFDIYMQINVLSSEMRQKIAVGNRLFVDGLMQMEPNKAWAPNANSTIRLSYGSVCSYRPRDGVFYDYYTTLTGVMEKEGPAGGEFEVLPKLKELYYAKDFGPYGTNNLVVCFITNNDITGGNSGSPVINGNGELIGVAFDGNSEAMSGDIDFEHNLQRCINVDTRYVLFTIDKIAGAKNLINEMTIVY